MTLRVEVGGGGVKTQSIRLENILSWQQTALGAVQTQSTATERNAKYTAAWDTLSYLKVTNNTIVMIK